MLLIVTGDDGLLTLIAVALQKFFSTDVQDHKQQNCGKRDQMHRLCQVMQDALRIGGLL